MKDYKSMCAAVTICATFVNTQTHTHTDTQPIALKINEMKKTKAKSVEHKKSEEQSKSQCDWWDASRLYTVSQTSSSAMAERPRELDQRFQMGVNLRLL